MQFFFLDLFSVKKGLELRFNDVLDRKETFLIIKTKFFNVSKIAFVQRGSPMLSVKKCNFFLDLFSVKKGLEIRFNDVLDREETFFDYKKKIF